MCARGQAIPGLQQAVGGRPGLQFKSGGSAVSLLVPTSALGAACSLDDWLGHCPEINSLLFSPYFFGKLGEYHSLLYYL